MSFEQGTLATIKPLQQQGTGTPAEITASAWLAPV